MKIMSMKGEKAVSSLIIIMAALFWVSPCIVLPLSTNKDRCMIVYGTSQEQTVKLIIEFPVITGHVEGDHYLLTIKNTETGQVHYETINSGTFKKELDLKKTVIYDVCMSVRAKKMVTDLFVDYQAHVQFYFDQIEVKIPESLLKTEDLHQSFYLAGHLTELSRAFKEHQSERTASNDKIFNQTTETSDFLIIVSGIELVAIAIAAGIQFWVIRGHLSTRQYI